MSTSHHLVTVCMVCLLCATHSSCSAHDGVVSENGLRKFQDLRHERFKANNIVTPRGYSRPFRVRYLGKIDKDPLQSKEDSFYTVKDVNYRVGDNVQSEETERLNDRLGTNLVDGGERKDKIYLKNLLLNSNSLKDGIRRRGKSVGNVPIDLVYFQTAYMESDPHTKLKDDSGHHRTNYYENKDISIRKLGRRRGVGESVDFIRSDGAKFENLPTGREHLFSDEQEMDNLGVLSNDFDVVERRFRILKSKGDDREADKAVISDILRTEDEQLNRILRDNSNNIEAGSDSNTQISSRINLRNDEATRHNAEDDFKVRSDARILNNLEASSDSNTLISSQINSRHNEAIRYNAEDALKMRRDARILNNLEASSDSNTLISSQINSRHNEAIRHNAEDDLKVRKDTRILNNLEASSDLNTPISPRLNLRSDEAIKSNIEDNLILGRIRRDAHLPEGEGKKNKKDNETSAEITTPVEYKPNLKNIDVEFYVKKLFMQFGDMETMTMSLEGFDSMLKVLNLDRMVLESKQPPIETVVNGERSNSTNVKCINSVDLISSLNAQSKPHLLHSLHDHDHSETEPTPKNTTAATIVSLDSMKANIRLNAHILAKVCPILLYQKVAQTSYEQQGCIVEREHPKVNTNSDSLYHFKDNASDGQSYFKAMDNRTAVWTYSCLCILVISLCGLLGVAVIPIMHHAYYQQILQFLVALAVGTLSGDALLHLLPHALSPHTLSSESGHHDQHSHDAMWKGLVAMVGVIFFYFTEKGLTLITEWRQRKMRTEKVNKLPLRVRVMRNDIGCLKGSGSCSSHTGKDGFLQLPAALSIFKPGSNNKEDEQNAVPSSGKICKHKYSEYPYCYDEIAAETMDDLHVQDQNSSNSKTYNSKNMSSGDKVNDDGPLSVVSLNVMNDQDHSNSEPGVNDSLLSGDGSKNPGIANNRVQAKDYKKEDFTPVLDAKKKLETSNGGKRRMGVKIVDKHARSRSADRAAELEDDLRKSSNQEEGYTVIIREHSQAHHGHSHSHGHVHSPPSSLSSVVWMVIMGDGLHNFTDGMAIGAAFSSNIAGGFSTAIAVLCHELPHEIGDFAVLLKAGMSAKRAVCYNLLSSLLCLVGMVVGIAAGHTPEATSWIFAAAAGMFLYIALVDMIPELSSTHSKEGSLCQCVLQLSGLTCGIGIMLLIAMYEEQLKMLFG